MVQNDCGSKKLDGIIAISNYLKNYYQSCKNVVVIPPLVDFCEEKWSVEAENLGEGVNFIYSGQPGKKTKLVKLLPHFPKLQKMATANYLWWELIKSSFEKQSSIHGSGCARIGSLFRQSAS